MVKDYDMGTIAAMVSAIASICILLGGLAAWILARVFDRITVLEQSHIAIKEVQSEMREDIKESLRLSHSLHERLDGHFLGTGRRADRPASICDTDGGGSCDK
jgi:hypothetical protein